MNIICRKRVYFLLPQALSPCGCSQWENTANNRFIPLLEFRMPQCFPRQCAATRSQHLQLALLILVAFVWKNFPYFDPNPTTAKRTQFSNLALSIFTENRYWVRLSMEAILFESK
ncbi:hypothetical protein BD408DRAFT_422702 [Parasitella parasitica]|nr:hypothetical protein BD408DRAFT_422702 [Parasitella parasitica]